MKQPSLLSRKDYLDIVEDAVSIVRIPRTRKSVKLHWIKPYTMERLTKVWIERDLASAEVRTGAETLKDLAKEPYFAFKEAALVILNHDIKIRLFYGFLWRWLAHKYDETQIAPIIAESKKKLPLRSRYEVMAYSMDMRTDMMKMAAKEAEQYQAELLLAAKRLSSKTSPHTASPDGGFSVGSETSDTDASSPAPK